MKKYLIVLLLLFTAGLIQCTPMEKKYEYSIEVTSADGYECSISWRGCYMGKYSMPFSTAGSWGYGGSAEATGPREKVLPDSVRLIYYSLTEDQFYGLSAAIPREKIEPLLEARYKRLNDYYRDARYTTFSFGLAPCGFVSLWLAGSAGQVLIDTFRAEKIEFNYRTAFPTRTWSREEAFPEYTKDLYPFIKQEMQEGRISSAYWESLNQSYNWKLVFSDDRFSLYNYDIYLLNQENREYITEVQWPVVEGNKTIPAHLILYLQHELDPVKYKVIINLRDDHVKYPVDVDEEVTVLKHMNKSRALLQFFDSFYRKSAGKEVSIYVDLDDSMESLKLKLRSGDYEEEFPDYTYQIYDSERYDYR